MRTLINDIHYGVRILCKNPGFTTVVVLTLALGIGANTAIFSVINALMLKPLPGVKDPQRLVLLTDNGNASHSYPLYGYLRDNSHSFSDLFVSSGVDKRKLRVLGSGDSHAESVWTQPVSGSFFSALGIQAVCGRLMMPDDDCSGDPQPIAVISYEFWSRYFEQDPSVIGKTVTLEDVPLTIVGVAPREFMGFVVGKRTELWWPVQMMPQVEKWWTDALKGGSQWLQIAGRLKPGVSVAQARDELDVVIKRRRLEKVEQRGWSGKKRDEYLNNRIDLEPAGIGYTRWRREFQRPLFVLMALVGIVLLLACTNLAGLLAVRGERRLRELCIRAATGADRLTLIRQLVTENLLLVVVGGFLGLLLAQWGVRLLISYIPKYGENFLIELAPDLRILTFTFLVSIGTGLFFGLLPAWRTTRFDLVTILKNEAGSVSGRASGQFWHKLFVISQITLACILLIGAGLFVRTLQTLKAVDTGFTRKNLVVFGLNLDWDYDGDLRKQLHTELLRQLENLPSVNSASLASVQSMGGHAVYFTPHVSADADVAMAGQGLNCEGVGVAPNYLKTMGISLLAGRDFGPEDLVAVNAGDAKQALRKVVLSESLAESLFGGENPIGRHLWESGNSEPTLEVIGIVRDIRHMRLRHEASTKQFYHLDIRGYGSNFYVRTGNNAGAVMGSIRRLIREVAPDVEVISPRLMEDVVDEQLRQEWMLSKVAGFFSVCALSLACLGLYGTLSYSVTRRTREIGVRIALGACKCNILAVVMRQGMTLTLLGCALGVILALALTRILSSLLYGITPTDPLTFALTILLLGVVGLMSCWFPARRAAKIDPMEALRYE